MAALQSDVNKKLASRTYTVQSSYDNAVKLSCTRPASARR